MQCVTLRSITVVIHIQVSTRKQASSLGDNHTEMHVLSQLQAKRDAYLDWMVVVLINEHVYAVALLGLYAADIISGQLSAVSQLPDP